MPRNTDLSLFTFTRRAGNKCVLDISFDSPVGTEKVLEEILTSGNSQIWSEGHNQDDNNGWVTLRLSHQDALFSTVVDQMLLQNGGTSDRVDAVKPKSGSSSGPAFQNIPGVFEVSCGKFGLIVKKEDVKHTTINRTKMRTPPRKPHRQQYHG